MCLNWHEINHYYNTKDQKINCFSDLMEKLETIWFVASQKLFRFFENSVRLINQINFLTGYPTYS